MAIYGIASLIIFIRQRQLDQPQASLEHEEMLNYKLAKAAALQDRWACMSLMQPPITLLKASELLVANAGVLCIATRLVANNVLVKEAVGEFCKFPILSSKMTQRYYRRVYMFPCRLPYGYTQSMTDLPGYFGKADTC